jgi:phospholipase C
MSEQPDKKLPLTELPHPYIKHVVVLMLENRGFDHLMGWLYDKNETPQIVTRDGDGRPFIGLSGMSDDELRALANIAPDGSDPIPIGKGARSPKTPSYNTGESFQHIMNQMWGAGLKSDAWLTAKARKATIQKLGGQPNMKGYVLDYDLETSHVAGGQLGRKELSEVMDTYRPEQVPVLSGLARNYAVSDEWYCSVPSQTNTNRAFVMTGTSRGLVNNSFYDPLTVNPMVGVMRVSEKYSHGDMRIWERVKALDFTLMKDLWSGELFKNGKSHADALPASTRSIFEVLQQHNYAWKVYWQTEWPPKFFTSGVSWQYTRVMIPLLQDPSFNDNFVQFDGSKPRNLLFEAAEAGDLPAFTWIEPKWGGGPQWNATFRSVGNDMHPVSDTTVAEDFVDGLYTALTKSPSWNQTLLVITFDENGGTYDHVFPPPAVPSGNDACPLVKPPIDRKDMDPQTRTQFGFEFDQYGIRVPTLLVSPCVPPGTIFRSVDPGGTPFDHASLIATVLRLAGLDPRVCDLGDRVSHAPTFDHMLGPPHARDTASALSVPFLRSGGPALTYNTDYILEFAGDIWCCKPGRAYLGPQATGVVGFVMGWHYPTITGDQTKAVRVRLVPNDGGSGTGSVTNMSTLLVKSTEPAVAQAPYFTVNWSTRNAYYATAQRPQPGSNTPVSSHWQIRILGSRNSEQVKVDDYIYLVAQLPPRSLEPEAVRPDPYQRLIRDPKNKSYLTTMAGEWALWRVRAAPPLQD